MNTQISEPGENKRFAGTALFNLGFRPFFLGAGAFAVISMSLWWLLYAGFLASQTLTSAWHAHEMIFGYAVAVIAGFLLTSIKNWTGLATVSGASLFVLFCLWMLARVANVMASAPTAIMVAAIADLSFMMMFAWCAVLPIIKVKQWRQTIVMLVISLLAVANGLYYAGQLEILANGVYLGIYLGFFLVTGMVLLMAGRVVPFFIKNGVPEDVQMDARPALEVANFIAYLLFVMVQIFDQYSGYSLVLMSALALILFVLNSIRLYHWYSKGIWQKPLLWSLYLAYFFIVVGFLLFALLQFGWFSIFLPLHAIAVGGIGAITLSMMARVSLGHSGRSIHEPPTSVVIGLVLILFAAEARALLPILLPEYYLFWIQSSQILWIIAFSLFLFSYAPILTQPRIDGRPG